MVRPININSKGEEINLQAKKYQIFILGGWGVDIGGFAVWFKEQSNGEITKCKKATLPVQAFAFRKRAKRVFVVDILRSGNYEVIFEKSKTLKVKKSNLLISSLFMSPSSTEKLEILITEKTGFFSFIK